MNVAATLGMLTLVVGVPLNAYVVLRLRRLSIEEPTFKVLAERLLTAALVLLVTVVFGLIFVQNDLVPPPIAVEVTKIITRASILALAILPATRWILLYRDR